MELNEQITIIIGEVKDDKDILATFTLNLKPEVLQKLSWMLKNENMKQIIIFNLRQAIMKAQKQFCNDFLTG